MEPGTRIRELRLLEKTRRHPQVAKTAGISIELRANKQGKQMEEQK